ncbi:MAG: hypothetical protein K8R54_10745 [Bacteroidales bacterium]|nr:hypothetical protein [Bacteroidales bacterium]
MILKKRNRDKELELLWDELKNVPCVENEDSELVIDENFEYFDKGTDVESIWNWFDENHTKGVGWLIYGIELS